MVPLESLLAGATLLTLAAVVAVVLDRDGVAVRDRLRGRFVLGIPWGSLITVVGVLGVYLVVQVGGGGRTPVEIPFRAWSYFYPLGIVTSSFAHAGESHLVGNLSAALVVAPLAEYAWGHYPPGERSVDRWWDRPWVRAVVIGPLTVLAVGLVIGVFALGPVIGFSGVIYALVGFAIVRYPIATLVAAVAGQAAVVTVYRALETPILVHTPTATGPSTPGWATVAIQAHALGLAIGLAIGLAVFARRDDRPGLLRLWVALVLFALANALWAVYWFGDDTYLLFRGPGVIAVLGLSAVVAIAVAGPAGDRGTTGGTLSSGLDRVVGAIGTHGLVVVLVLAAVLAGPALPANLFVVDDHDRPTEEGLSIRDYDVTYAEDVRNELVSVIDLSSLGLDTTVNASGVIVSSERRNVWHEAVTDRRLAATGQETVVLGGPGWREPVTAHRTGWDPVGNETAYQVWLEHDDERVLAHRSGATTADVVLAGSTVSIAPAGEAFDVVVRGPDGADSAALPAANESVTVGGVEVVHEHDVLYVVHADTRVRIATAR